MSNLSFVIEFEIIFIAITSSSERMLNYMRSQWYGSECECETSVNLDGADGHVTM